MDFDLMSEEIQSVPKPPSHHKKHSTFANVPFADTDGLDDFYGFSADETNQAQEIKELNQTLEQHKETIANKDQMIHTLQEENQSLKTAMNELTLQIQHKHGLKARDSNKMPTPETKTTETETMDASDLFDHAVPHSEHNVAIGHAISASLDNFLDNLDFKFKEDGEGDHAKDTLPPMKNEDDKDSEYYIYNPSAVLDIDGHLPPLRRSSLSEDEQQQMEIEVVKDIQRRTQSMGHDELNHVSNVIFNDTSVNNMNMSIVNHHNHTHKESDANGNQNVSNTEHLEKEIKILQQEIEQMKRAKIQLAIAANNEINSLRTIIRQRLK
eukprot:19215_1